MTKFFTVPGGMGGVNDASLDRRMIRSLFTLIVKSNETLKVSCLLLIILKVQN